MSEGRVSQVVALVPLPPPVNGAKLNSKKICDDLEQRNCDVLCINTGLTISGDTKRLRFHFKRIRNCVRNCRQMWCSVGKDDTVYTVPSAGWGLLYDLAYAAVLKLAGHKGRVFFHHHNFRHVATQSHLFGVLLALTGERATQVFLEYEQVPLFAQAYRWEGVSHVVRNAALCDVQPMKALEPRPADQTITVGYLSNLNDAKGFDVVERAFMDAAELSANLHFAIAGNPADKNTAGRLQRLQDKLGSRLRYHGHVSGEAKAEFFRNIDIFVFPTRYWRESQPNVIYEAMASGVIVVATRWACIPYMMDDAPHHLVDVGDLRATANQVVSVIQSEIADRDAFSSRCEKVLNEFARIQAGATYSYHAFLEDVGGPRASDDATVSIG